MVVVHVRPDFVKAIAARRNQSLTELAADFGQEFRYFQRLLSGQISPSPRTRRKMCKVAQCEFDDLFMIVGSDVTGVSV